MHCLLADIGGTNSRCALTGPDRTPTRIAVYDNADFRSVEAVLETYLKSLPGGERPRRAAVAVAAPVRGPEVSMMNIGWSFSAPELASRLAFSELRIVNDFAALACALPWLDGADLHAVGGGQARPEAPKVVLGPGTGLGTAGLVHANGRWWAVSGEGGHASLPALTPEEWRVTAAAHAQFGHCSAERVLSGPGLTLLHRVLHGGEELSAPALGTLLERDDPRAAETFRVFFRWLGTVASDLALTFGAFGGVYIGGGIVPRYLAAFEQSGFRERFENKGRYREYLSAIGTRVILAPHPAFTGLAALAAGEVALVDSA